MSVPACNLEDFWEIREIMGLRKSKDRPLEGGLQLFLKVQFRTIDWSFYSPLGNNYFADLKESILREQVDIFLTLVRLPSRGSPP